jgi:hypothetical protein
MPKIFRRWPVRHSAVLAWVAVGLLPFLLAGTCFDTTAPDIVTPAEDSTGTDSTSALHDGASILPENDGLDLRFTI